MGLWLISSLLYRLKTKNLFGHGHTQTDTDNDGSFPRSRCGCPQNHKSRLDTGALLPFSMNARPHLVANSHPSCYFGTMPEYRFTDYFEREVLRKRSYLKKEWCIRVVEAPLKTESQENNRYRFWGSIEELGGRILRVITLEDRLTIHNAFPDRSFKP
jgi:hypothetical protein